MKPKKGKGAKRRASRPDSGIAVSEILRLLREQFPEISGVDRHTGEKELVSGLLTLAQDLHDQSDSRLLPVAELLDKLFSQGLPEAVLFLAGGYLCNGFPALSIQQYRRFLAGWPDHEDVPEVRRVLKNLEVAARESGLIDLALVVAWEKMQLALSRGHLEQLTRLARETLELYPDDLPSRNNLSLAQFQLGKVEEALETALSVVDRQPSNIHALGNLVRICVALGRDDQAGTWAERLKSSSETASDRWGKIAEALSFVGDDEGILNALSSAKRSERTGTLCHFAAVSRARRGDWSGASELWKEALGLSPGLDLASENLDNSRQSEESRSSAWAFTLSHWLPTASVMKEIAKAVGPDKSRKMARLIDRIPYLRNVLPHILERGSPGDIRLMVGLAGVTPDRTIQQVLLSFAGGQSGSIDLRIQAARVCRQAGLLPAGSFRLWTGSQWSEFLLLDFDISWEIDKPHPRNVERVLRAALDAIAKNKLDEAEKLLEEALLLAPDAPDLLNNLALVYDRQGRTAEAIRVTERNNRCHPDYVRGAFSMALIKLHERKFAEARLLIEPLLRKIRLHVTEFALLCEVQIRLLRAEGNRPAADSWGQMWEQLEEQDPDCKTCRPASLEAASTGAGGGFLDRLRRR